MLSEAIAGLGLVALQEGRLKTAEELYGALDESSASNVFQDDWYRVAWFRASILLLTCPNDTVDFLVNAAERAAAYDVLSHLKLRFLAAVLRPSPAGGASGDKEATRHTAARMLRRHGLGWFVRVATRWWDTTKVTIKVH
jgi:hypothetical protein